ncbi:hypothetical protein ACF09Y_26475 [Streptomyces massasporeus]|uniref:hypothetical protein n=1 Tax=Streptomyces massasporeus TaxID=67324 RepID=UPI0036F7C977
MARSGGGGRTRRGAETFLTEEYGRLRMVVAVGDGRLLLTTSETDTWGTPVPGADRILRLDVR